MDSPKVTFHRFLDGIDYSIFIAMLALSAFFGIYFAYIVKKKPDTTTEYLIGDRKMAIFPIAMSLAASSISSVKFLGFSTEAYQHGSQLLLSVRATIIACLCLGTIFIPVLYRLNMISSYEYLQKRFNNAVRILGSVLFVIKMLIYSAANIHGPSIALAQASGFDARIIMPCVSIVCIFYTSIGGFKAVVWADTLQMILMIVGTFSVMIIGNYKAGGIENVWKENEKAGRNEFFNMNMDPTVRFTFWDLTVGLTFFFTGLYLVNQSVSQRCLALPSLKKAKIAIFIFCIFAVTFSITTIITALTAYAAFHDCDPITSKTISRDDQIIPYFMMTISEYIPGIPGIFVSALFSASLSSISTGLNSIAGVILIDFIRPLWKRPIPEVNEAFLMKIIVFISGMIYIALAFLIDKIGGIWQTVISFQAISQGTLLGIFFLGMLFPWANSKGALTGGIAASSLLAWMCIGAQLNKKQMIVLKKGLTIDGCDNSTLENYYSFLNKTTTIKDKFDQDEIPFLYKISPSYNNLIGALVVIIVGLIISFLTGANNPKEMDPILFPKIVSRLCKSKKRSRTGENKKLMKKKQNV